MPSRFDKSWIEILLAHAIRATMVARIVVSRLRVEDIELPVHQLIWRVFVEYFQQWNMVPTSTALLEGLRRLVLEGHARESDLGVLAYTVSQIYRTPLDSNWFLAEFETYIKTIRIGNVLAIGPELIRTGEFDKLQHEFRQACTQAYVAAKGPVSPFAQFMAIDHENYIPTMIPDVDAALGGGLAPGECGMVMAITGGGKSIFLTNAFFGAAIHQRNSLYASFEMGEKKIANRLYSLATGIAYRQVKTAPPEMQQRIIERCKRFEPYTRIQTYLDRPASLHDVEATILQLADSGWPTHLLITDWLDCIVSQRYGPEPGNRVDTRNVLQAVAEEHVQLAQRLKIPVWTATQTNRSAIGRGIVDLRHTAEAYSKAWRLDVVLTLQQAMENPKLFNCYTAKNRDNPKVLLKLLGDLDHMKFRPWTGGATT